MWPRSFPFGALRFGRGGRVSDDGIFVAAGNSDDGIFVAAGDSDDGIFVAAGNSDDGIFVAAPSGAALSPSANCLWQANRSG